MKSIIHLLFITTLVIACNNNPTEPAAVNTNGTADSAEANYLPVTDLIREDIKKVDSFAGAILNRRNINGKKDSAYIKPADFHQVAGQFLLPELDPASFAGQFTESSLMDETTQLLNFIYTAKSADQPLQKVIVYVKPTPTHDKVERIYFERNTASGDTLKEQKFTWKMGDFFYILTVSQPKGGPAVTSMNKVIWNPEHFAEE